MTPAARIASAVSLLDEILGGAPAERVLTRWARRSRYAGSRDREAVRDHVYDALRRRRSYAALGGSDTGRGLMLGAVRAAGSDPGGVFTGEGYAPPPLSPAERDHRPPAMPPAVALDCPDWLWPVVHASLGDRAGAVLEALRHRAPLTLRVNRRKGTVEDAVRALGDEGLEVQPNPLSPTALDVANAGRALQSSQAYRSGLVELQDAGSQAVSDDLAAFAGGRVLDYCAGGGGKTLALAARADARYFAHDIDPARMSDLPARAERAGAEVTILDEAGCRAEGPFELVIVDAPCSGSGAWRRSPEAKWRLSESRLRDLVDLQGAILDRAAELTVARGTLAYITCSLLELENGSVARSFMARKPDWTLISERRLTPLDGGDGFYLALLTRRNGGVT